LAQNPAYARKMSEKLEEILRRFKDDWDTLERELRRFIQDLRKGPTPIPGAPNITVPFVLLIADQLGGWDSISDSQKSKVVQVTVEMVERIQQEVRKVGFWRNLYAREVLTKALVRDLDASRLFPPDKERDLAQQLVALAKENHENLTR
jgi:type I restriction enzyme R subunit